MKLFSIAFTGVAFGVIGVYLLVVTIGILLRQAPATTVPATGHAASQTASIASGSVRVVRSDGPVPEDPLSPVWDAATIHQVEVLPQQMTMPQLKEPSLTSLRVSALYDGERIAWKLVWPDPNESASIDSNVFCDAAALQFPIGGDAPFTMGMNARPVNIVQWKAIWQHDIDVQFQDVQDLHPNYWTDLYWFAEGEFPNRITESFGDPRSRQWLIGYSAGNPTSRLDRSQPVQEFTAEGFGTLTPQEDSQSVGRGSWRDGWWAVSFVQPMHSSDENDVQFRAESRGQVAFAIWEGSADNVGGRKHYSQWIDYEIGR